MYFIIIMYGVCGCMCHSTRIEVRGQLCVLGIGHWAFKAST